MSVINTATSTSTVGAVASPNRQELEKAVAVQHARVEALDERLKQEISTVAGLCQQVRQTQGTPTTNVQDPPDAGIVASSFAVLPPEINSGRMFLGAGSAPMLQASAAWDGLAAELASTSKSLEAVSDQRKEAFESLAKATRDLGEQ